MEHVILFFTWLGVIAGVLRTLADERDFRTAAYFVNNILACAGAMTVAGFLVAVIWAALGVL